LILIVIPAKAGIHFTVWIPILMGMTDFINCN